MDYEDQITALEQALYDMQTHTWLCDSPGNMIVPELASTFIKAFMDTEK